MKLIDRPLITIGAILLALTAAIFGGICVIQGKLTYKEYQDSITVLAGIFVGGSALARAAQGFGTAKKKDPYE